MANEGGSSLHCLASLQAQGKQQRDQCSSTVHAQGVQGQQVRLAQGSLRICFCKHLPPLPLVPVFEFSVSVLLLLERIITCTQFQQCLSSAYFWYIYKSAAISTKVNFVTHYKTGVS